MMRSQIDAAPLVRALTHIANKARDRKAAGIDDEAVAYGRVAHAALAWMDADEAQEFETAEQWLRKIPMEA